MRPGPAATLSRGAVALAHAAARVLRAAIILLGALATLALAATLVLAWRLGQGPLDLDWLVQRLLPGRSPPLVIGHAELEWQGFAAGPASAVSLRLASVHAGTAAFVETAAATLSLTGLLHGEVAPGTVHLEHLSIRLVRDAGGIRLDPPPAPSPTEPGTDLPRMLSGLAHPPDGQAAPGLAGLERLREVRVDGVDVTLHDDASGTDAHLVLATVAAEREDVGGIRGTAAGTLALAAMEARLSLDATVAPDGGTRLQLAMAPLDVAGLHGLAPSLDALQAAHVPVGGTATLLLSPALLPAAATLHLDAGPGTAQVVDKLIRLDRAALDAEASWPADPAWTIPTRLQLRNATATVHAPHGPVAVTASMDATRNDAGLAATLDAAVDHVAFADLPGLWPSGVLHHIRPWLTENITAGTAHDATVRMALTAALDGSKLRLASVDGRLQGEDLTIHWLRPVPPLDHATATLAIRTPQLLDIDVPTARQGNLQLRHGHVRITGLDVKDQSLALALDMDGGVPDLIALLANKRLNLLNKHPLPMRNPAGTLAGHLAVDFPLNHDLRFDQVAISTQAQFQGLHLGGLVAGRDLDGGDIALSATVEGLKATGHARVAGVPSQMAVSMDFREGPPTQVVLNADLAARATARQLAMAGLDPGAAMTSGTVAVTGRYDERRNGQARLQATADAQDAGLALLGWRKAPGPSAHAAATVLIEHGRLAGIEALQASGPGLEVDAHIRTVDGRPLDLVLNRVVLGGTHAAGEVRFPEAQGGAIRIQLSGPALDLSTQFASAAPPTSAAPSGPPTDEKDGRSTPFVADVRFDRVVLAHGSTVSGAAGHVDYDGRKVTALHATTGAPEYLVADISPDGTGRRVMLRAADGGAALRALDITEAVRGGTLAVEARYDDTLAPPVLSGQAKLAGFHVGAAVVAGKVLQALTLYGVPEALNGPGVLFDRLVLPFRWNGTRLDVLGARAFSASLGLTAAGSVDRAKGQIDLQGTVVPVYLLNSMLGRLPLVGRLFSPEAGSGVVAMDWSLRGPVADPTVRANPLSLLTPGILRRLFHVFDREGP